MVIPKNCISKLTMVNATNVNTQQWWFLTIVIPNIGNFQQW